MGGRPGQQLAAKATSDQLLPKMIPRNCFLSDLRGTSRTGMLKLLTRISVSLLLCFSEMVRARSWTAGSRNARRCRTRRWRRGFVCPNTNSQAKWTSSSTWISWV